MKNKRGDISITLLVIGVFAVCALTLFSFYLSGSDAKKIAIPALMSEKVNSLAEEVRFYKSPEINKKPEELMDIFYKAQDDKNPSFTGSIENEIYTIKAVYFTDSVKLLGFGFGDKREEFSIEHKFKA